MIVIKILFKQLRKTILNKLLKKTYTVPPVVQPLLEPTISKNMVDWLRAYFTLARTMEIAKSESSDPVYQMGLICGINLMVQTLENIHADQVTVD